MVDKKYTVEIDSENKKLSQTKEMQNSFVVTDGIEIGVGNKIFCLLVQINKIS